MKLEYINKDTGEVTPLADEAKARFNKQTDIATITSTNLDLTPEQIIELRATTNTITGAQIVTGLGVGLLVGKGVFTGACIALATMTMADVITPTDWIYKKKLNIK